MFEPASLQIPGICGGVAGVLVGAALWDFNHVLAVVVGLVIFGLGLWLGWWLSKKFHESLERDQEKGKVK